MTTETKPTIWRKIALGSAAALIAAGLASCSTATDDDDGPETGSTETSQIESSGEHADNTETPESTEATRVEATESAQEATGSAQEGTGEGSESGAESGEESATQYTKTDTYDETRAGARLILNYDAASNSFVETVENTTNAPLSNVRVEVHLSNGIELGPTTPTDLAAGETINVTLPASDTPFDTFGAHPEVGGGGEGTGEHGGESGEGGESGGEHGEGGEEGGEHGG